jgi:hypothetical protein
MWFVWEGVLESVQPEAAREPSPQAPLRHQMSIVRERVQIGVVHEEASHLLPQRYASQERATYVNKIIKLPTNV